MARFVCPIVLTVTCSSNFVPEGRDKLQSLLEAVSVTRFLLTMVICILWVAENIKMYSHCQCCFSPIHAFTGLFVFRYLRFIIHLVAFMFYRPTPVADPKGDSIFHACDVTAVMATVEPEGADFRATIQSSLDAGCAKLIIVTINERYEETRLLCEYISSRIQVLSSSIANKRVQLCIGLMHVQTKIVLFTDDHVWFQEPIAFIRSILAPFENPKVGGVAVGKRVRRLNGLGKFSTADILNFLACSYLERHNFDLAASNTIDGGVFVISGRTAAYRSSIICNADFFKSFTNEKWFFGVGPLHADDDNCMTRWLVNKGWKIKFQHSKDALMHTTLGVNGFRKYQSQCLRWVRTTWRSNSTSLFKDRTVWRTQPWCVYAVYFSSFFNFALFTDMALLILGNASFTEVWIGKTTGMLLLVFWILGSKIIKLIPHLIRNPCDIWYFPLYVVFAYYHSFIKLWALFTVHSLSWGSRPHVVS